MAEQIGGMFNETDLIVVDESGQAPFAQMLSMLTNFPKLGKLLVAGDRWQLSVNLTEVPEAAQNSYGLDTTILNLDSASGVDRTTLTVNFRSHPFITECIEAGVYSAHGETLVSGRNATQMNHFTAQTPIALPVPNCPILLIHQTDHMHENPTSFSATNPMQTRTVIEFLTFLRPSFPGIIRIVCFYAGQAKEIGNEIQRLEIPNVLTTTVDGCQGHEAEFCCVVTTKTGIDASRASGAFWNDERRVNVALSRSKYGMAVIGDLELLWSAGGIWKRFLKRALQQAVAMTPEYTQVMTNPNPQFQEGVIIGPNGPIRAHDFYDNWGGPTACSSSVSRRPLQQSPRPAAPRPQVAPPMNRFVPAGLCNYCLRPGHHIRDCADRPGTSQSNGRVNSRRPPRQWTNSNRGGRGEGRRNY